MITMMLLATTVTAILCLALIPIARKIGLVDHPGERKVHQVSTPLTGGPALLITYGLMLLFMGQGSMLLQGVAAGGFLMYIVGLIDDLYPLTARVRFLAQLIACMVVITYTGVRLEDFGQLFWSSQLNLGWMSIPITVFAALGVINAFNMIDGMDGLAGTIFMVAAAGAAFLAGVTGQVKLQIMLLAALSSVFGYLLLNARFPWNDKARIFMGDSGSQFLGFFLAWCLISLGNDHNETGQRSFMPMTAVWLFAVPLLDTSTVMWRRIKSGRSPFTADQHHLHHAFLRAGFTVRQTWLAITGLAVALAGIGMAFELTLLPEYLSFWTFIVLAFAFKYYIKQTWYLQQFLGRDFIYNEPDN